MIRRPPRSTLDRSSAASDVYKSQPFVLAGSAIDQRQRNIVEQVHAWQQVESLEDETERVVAQARQRIPVSYTHLRAHETVLDLVCRLLLEKKKKVKTQSLI